MTSRFGKQWGSAAGRAPLELDVQKQIIKLLRDYARDGVIYWHTPNGEKRDIGTAQKLKSMGVMPGVVDLILMDTNRGGFFAMEVKRPGEKPEPEQVKFMAGFKNAGGRAAVWVDSLPQAMAYLSEWNLIRIATRT